MIEEAGEGKICNAMCDGPDGAAEAREKEKTDEQREREREIERER